MDSDFQLLYYFGLWQLVSCLFAFLGLLSIWYHIGRKQGDFGQVWLALSILCWSLSGYVDSYYGGQLAFTIFDQPGLDNKEAFWSSKIFHMTGWKSMLSLLNSLFILLALPWFRHLPRQLESMIKSKYWPVIVGLPFIFSLLPTISKFYNASNLSLISELDVYYSILTLLVLGWVLWTSFLKRRLALLAILSAICILITFAAQVFKLSDDGNTQILFSAIFKTSFIMIFFALALSWVKDLTERIQIKAEDVFLKLTKVKNGRSFLNILSVQGVIGKEIQEVNLTNKNYDLLKHFIDKRKNTDDGWLVIKPKSSNMSGRIYDINDHNEMKRLLHSILDGLYGKELWSKSEHEIPLKKILFEVSKDKERHVRLGIHSSNLSVS